MLAIIVCFSISFILVSVSLPWLIRFAAGRGLVDKPDQRKSHTANTPTFGGVCIFIGVLLVAILGIPAEQYNEFKFVLGALILMFIIGLIDDLEPISPWQKLFGQFVVVLLLVYFAGIRLTNFYGIFGIQELPYEASLILSSLVFIFLINSFNLIDGINGLSSSVAIFVSSVLAIWFVYSGQHSFAILSAAVTGSTLAFLRYNITPAKIFMGDTGSLVLGTICAILTVKFLETNASSQGMPYTFQSGPSIAVSLLILPIFDTLRVFIIRISRGRSPFSPDKNHIHHLLLDAGYSHMQSTSMLLITNFVFVLAAIQLQEVSPLLFIGCALLMASVLTWSLRMTVQLKKRGIVRS